MIEYRGYIIINPFDKDDYSEFYRQIVNDDHIAKKMRAATRDELLKFGYYSDNTIFIFFPKNHKIRTALDHFRGYPNPLFSYPERSVDDAKYEIDKWIEKMGECDISLV